MEEGVNEALNEPQVGHFKIKVLIMTYTYFF